MGRDSTEGAFRAGDDFVGTQAFQDFRELVEIAPDDDVRFLVAIAGTFGHKQSGLDVVGCDDEEFGVLDTGVDSELSCLASSTIMGSPSRMRSSTAAACLSIKM